MNASYFLFTFDLPLSPYKPEKKAIFFKKKGVGWWGADRGSGGGRVGQKEQERGKMGGRGAPPLSFFISPLSLAPFLLLSLEGRTWWPVLLPRRTSSWVYLAHRGSELILIYFMCYFYFIIWKLVFKQCWMRGRRSPLTKSYLNQRKE